MGHQRVQIQKNKNISAVFITGSEQDPDPQALPPTVPMGLGYHFHALQMTEQFFVMCPKNRRSGFPRNLCNARIVSAMIASASICGCLRSVVCESHYLFGSLQNEVTMTNTDHFKEGSVTRA
jgi:hypothetical protein